MMQRYLELRRTLNFWLNSNSKVGAKMARDYKISEAEWSLIINITGILRKFDSANKQMLGSTYVTLPYVLPLFFELLDFLNSKMVPMRVTDQLYLALFTCN